MTEALNTLTQRFDTVERKHDVRHGMTENAVRLHAAKFDILSDRVERQTSLFREVVKARGEEAGRAADKLIKAVDDSKQIITQRADPDEITGPQVKRWAIRHVVPWLLKHALKIASGIAAVSVASWHFAEAELRAVGRFIKHLFE